MTRVQEFLLEEDQEKTAVMDDKIAHAVDVRDASFTWERTRTQDSETDDEKGLKGKAQTDAKKPTSIEEGNTSSERTGALQVAPSQLPGRQKRARCCYWECWQR